MNNENNDLGPYDNLKIWTEQVISGDLKEAVNLFIWRWGHPELTLAQAEEMAIEIFDRLSEAPKKKVIGL